MRERPDRPRVGRARAVDRRRSRRGCVRGARSGPRGETRLPRKLDVVYREALPSQTMKQLFQRSRVRSNPPRSGDTGTCESSLAGRASRSSATRSRSSRCSSAIHDHGAGTTRCRCPAAGRGPAHCPARALGRSRRRPHTTPARVLVSVRAGSRRLCASALAFASVARPDARYSWPPCRPSRPSRGRPGPPWCPASWGRRRPGVRSVASSSPHHARRHRWPSGRRTARGRVRHHVAAAAWTRATFAGAGRRRCCGPYATRRRWPPPPTGRRAREPWTGRGSSAADTLLFPLLLGLLAFVVCRRNHQRGRGVPCP